MNGFTPAVCAWGLGRTIQEALRLEFDHYWTECFHSLVDGAERFAKKQTNRRAMLLIDRGQFFVNFERSWEIFGIEATYALDRDAAALVMGARRVERDGGNTLLRAAARLKGAQR